MKDWKLLTDEELAALTDKEVEFYKKLLYAENGIKMLVKPNEPESLKEPCDMTVYYVEGVGDKMIFASLEEAKEFVTFIKEHRSIGHLCHQSNTGYNRYYFELGLKDEGYSWSPNPYSIQSKEAYSKEKYLEMQCQLVAYESMKQQYDKDLAEYEKVNNRAIEVTAEFLNTLNTARNTIERRKRLTDKFYNDYMPLAENNYHVAMGFMKKAYDISDDDEMYIKNNPKKEENA